MALFRYVVAGGFWFCLSSVGYAGSFEGDFMLLAEKCRAAIETTEELNTSGLREVPASAKQKRSGSFAAWQIDDDSSWLLTINKSTANNEQPHRLCDVFVKEDRKPVGKTQQAEVIRSFLQQKVNLMGQQTHQEDKGLSSIYPLLLLGFERIEKNSRGCLTVSALALNFDGTFLRYFAGEKTTKGSC